jgi:predicted transcriptional regulator
MSKFNKSLLDAVAELGFSVEELSGILNIPEYNLFRILGGREIAGSETRKTLSAVLGKPIDQLFPEEDRR